MSKSYKKGGKLKLPSLKSIIKPREIAPPHVRDFLTKYGDDEIIGIYICRKPIDRNIDIVLNLISLGKIKKYKDEIGYDDLYHIYMIIITVRDSYILEKNHVVELRQYDKIDNNCIIVNFNKGITIKQLLDNGYKYQGNSFWLYDPITNNCQVFIMSILKGNGLNNEYLQKYVLQDVGDLLTSNVYKLSKFITDAAAISDIFFNGYGI